MVELFPGPKIHIFEAKSQKGNTDLFLTRTQLHWHFSLGDKGKLCQTMKKVTFLPTTLDLLLSVQQAEASSVGLPCVRWSTLQSHILAVWLWNMKWLQWHLLLICRLHWCPETIYRQNQPTWTASSNIVPLSVGSLSPKNQLVLDNIDTPTQEFLSKHSGDTQFTQNLFSRRIKKPGWMQHDSLCSGLKRGSSI